MLLTDNVVDYIKKKLAAVCTFDYHALILLGPIYGLVRCFCNLFRLLFDLCYHINCLRSFSITGQVE